MVHTVVQIVLIPHQTRLISVLLRIIRAVYRALTLAYHSRALLGACAYNSTGRKYVPISEMHLIINNDIPS